MGACALTRKVHATPFLLHCFVYGVLNSRAESHDRYTSVYITGKLGQLVTTEAGLTTRHACLSQVVLVSCPLMKLAGDSGQCPQKKDILQSGCCLLREFHHVTPEILHSI